MTKRQKLKICNWVLLLLTILMLASGIMLESTHSSATAAVWLHIGLGLVFFGVIVWHLYLHFQWKGWISRLRKQKSPVTRWLAITGALTLLLGIAALIHWSGSGLHAPIGGIHGKIGFLFLALAIAHAFKRHKFYS